MRFSTFLKRNGLTVADAAHTLRLGHERTRLYAKGKRRPRWLIIHRINIWSGGAVVEKDWRKPRK